MKKIVLIHTVQSVALSFGTMLQDALTEKIKIYNILDEFLAENPNEIGRFSIENYNRLFYIIKSAELTDVDFIVTTCSTLTPIVELIKPFIKIPIITIDNNMAKTAVEKGQNILILATAKSALEATSEKIQKEVDLNKKKVTVNNLLVNEAFEFLKKMKIAEHDKAIIESVLSKTNIDCIVLAQASMVHLKEKLHHATGALVLDSPTLCIEEIRKNLKI